MCRHWEVFVCHLWVIWGVAMDMGVCRCVEGEVVRVWCSGVRVKLESVRSHYAGPQGAEVLTAVVERRRV